MTSDLYTAVDADLPFYHNGHRSSPEFQKNSGHRKPPPIEDRRVIAWDMEGMSLDGDDKPQNAVLFGCSAEPDQAFTGRDLSSLDMLAYIVDIGRRYPHSIHVGFGFRYDGNMLIKDLPDRLIIRLWKFGRARFKTHGGLVLWSLQWRPGKTFTVTQYSDGRKRDTKSAKHSVTIHDFSSFFGGQAFLAVAEDVLRDTLTDEDRHTIAHGKAQRGFNTWDKLSEVRHYWDREIRLIQRTFERFRDVMCQEGFKLNASEWYGPGGLANYINSSRKIHQHLAGAQVTSGHMPPEVHHASKIAFAGGRFELFQAGRHKGPIWAIDVNNAYPYALSMIPSLHPDEGEWVHVDKPDRIKRFGFYEITFREPHGKPFEFRPMPLFWRDHRGFVSYPNMVTGWYASPEARMMLNMPGAEIKQGWFWNSREEIFPWEFLHEMYATRQRLGKRNLLSLPYKLGPNSLYGKYAQTVGWNRKERKPPRSHALPVAAWITSYCRSQLWDIIRQSPADVISVETDSVFLSRDPSTLRLTIGDELGNWSNTTYDEVIYVQSGMYHTRQGDTWTGTKSRGLRRAEYPVDVAREYLQSLMAGHPWPPLTLTTAPRFIGAGMALMSSRPFASEHCVWRPQVREITLGDTGKRRHVGKVCQACARGSTPWDEPHRLLIASRSDGEQISQPRRLPWEQKQIPDVARFQRDALLEKELITR